MLMRSTSAASSVQEMPRAGLLWTVTRAGTGVWTWTGTRARFAAGPGAGLDGQNGHKQLFKAHTVVCPALENTQPPTPAFLVLSKSHNSSIHLTPQCTSLTITPEASPGIRCRTREHQAPQNHAQSQRHVRRAARCISRPSLSSLVARDAPSLPPLPLPGDSRCHAGLCAVMECGLRQCAVAANTTSARALAPTGSPATPPPSPGGARVLIWCELFGQG